MPPAIFFGTFGELRRALGNSASGRIFTRMAENLLFDSAERRHTIGFAYEA
jgi:hypothetical protein